MKKTVLWMMRIALVAEELVTIDVHELNRSGKKYDQFLSVVRSRSVVKRGREREKIGNGLSLMLFVRGNV